VVDGSLTLVFAGGAVAVGLAESRSDRWWWVGGFGVVWSASVFYMVNRGYGRKCLSADAEFERKLSVIQERWSRAIGG
jgi:hypothetical protein